MQAGLSTKNAPSVWVVVPHFIIGAINLLIASLFILFNYDDLLGYHINGQILSIVHLLILGWVSIIIFGALYQLIPVVMEIKLYSEKLAYFTLGSLIIGLFFLIVAFLGYKFQLTNNFIVGGSLIITAIVLFTINTLKSALSSKKKSISKLFIIASGFYLLLNVLLGLFILINLSYNLIPIAHTVFLKTHAVIGLAGWFIMLIIGVSAKLMPMFLIVHKTREDLLKWSFYLINTGIIINFISIFLNPALTFINSLSLIIIIAGFAMFMIFNYKIFSKRLRRKLDIGMKLSAIGYILFALSILSFIASYFGNNLFGLPPGRIEIISGLLMIYGFFTSLILGQTYKTLPFIIWLFYYQALVGKQKTPLPGELYSENLAKIHMYSFIISIVLFVTGLLFSNKILVIAAAIAMLITTLVYGINVLKMIFHKKQIIK